MTERADPWQEAQRRSVELRARGHTYEAVAERLRQRGTLDFDVQELDGERVVAFTLSPEFRAAAALHEAMGESSPN